MATDIKMPQLSDTMSSGKILQWRKKEGDSVKRGDMLAEVETDKANLEIESFQEGTLLKITVPAGSNANVGEVIAVIGKAGEEIKSSPTVANEGAQAPKIESSTPPKTESAPAFLDNEKTNGAAASHDRIKASPLARKIAREKSIDLSVVHGSGPSGRITRKDVESVEHRSGTAEMPSSRTTPPTSAAAESKPLSKMRETIARRMQESVREAPHFYVTASINMGEASRLREVLKAKAEYKGISINHLVIKASAYALSHEPRVNNAMREGQVFSPGQINIGIITALEDGLLIPVIKEANKLSLKDLVFEARAAVERARAGRPTSGDLTGGTFSISNMGMFDVENFTAIINPGQGAVLAVSSIRQEAVVEDNQIKIGQRMKATISVDHRIIDGVMAGNFLKYFKEALEVPALLMV